MDFRGWGSQPSLVGGTALPANIHAFLIPESKIPSGNSGRGTKLVRRLAGTGVERRKPAK